MNSIRRTRHPLAVGTLVAVAATLAGGATAAGTTPVTDDSRTVVLDAGDPADALVLTLDWRRSAPVGTTLRNIERFAVSGTVTVGPDTTDIAASSELVETREVMTVDDSGSTVRAVVESYSADAANELSNRMMPTEPKGAVVGVPVIVDFDADDIRLAAVFEDLDDPSAEQRLALDEMLDGDNVVFPAEALGTGARWTAPFGEQTSDALIAEFELVEVTDTTFTATFHIADISSIFAIPGAQYGPESSLSGSVTGSLPGQPVRYSMNADTRAVFHATEPNSGAAIEFDLTLSQSATLSEA